MAEGTVLAGEVALAGRKKMKALGDAALNVAAGSDGMLNVEASAAVGDREYASSSLVYAIAPVNQPEVEAPTVGDDPEG